MLSVTLSGSIRLCSTTWVTRELPLFESVSLSYISYFFVLIIFVSLVILVIPVLRYRCLGEGLMHCSVEFVLGE